MQGRAGEAERTIVGSREEGEGPRTGVLIQKRDETETTNRDFVQYAIQV